MSTKIGEGDRRSASVEQAAVVVAHEEQREKRAEHRQAGDEEMVVGIGPRVDELPPECVHVFFVGPGSEVCPIPLLYKLFSAINRFLHRLS